MLGLSRAISQTSAAHFLREASGQRLRGFRSILYSWPLLPVAYRFCCGHNFPCYRILFIVASVLIHNDEVNKGTHRSADKVQVSAVVLLHLINTGLIVAKTFADGNSLSVWNWVDVFIKLAIAANFFVLLSDVTMVVSDWILEDGPNSDYSISLDGSITIMHPLFPRNMHKPNHDQERSTTNVTAECGGRFPYTWMEYERLQCESLSQISIIVR